MFQSIGLKLSMRVNNPISTINVAEFIVATNRKVSGRVEKIAFNRVRTSPKNLS